MKEIHEIKNEGVFVAVFIARRRSSLRFWSEAGLFIHTPREIYIELPETALGWIESWKYRGFDSMIFIKFTLAPSEIREPWHAFFGKPEKFQISRFIVINMKNLMLFFWSGFPFNS